MKQRQKKMRGRDAKNIYRYIRSPSCANVCVCVRMDPCARILVYKYLYRNARCPRRTTHLLLLLMPAAGTYTASAICCHCRYSSCITTYFNIMFFSMLLLLLLLLFSIAWLYICSSSSSTALFCTILPSFCLLFNKFIFPFVFTSYNVGLSIFLLLFQCVFVLFILCSVQFSFFSLLCCESTYISTSSSSSSSSSSSFFVGFL